MGNRKALKSCLLRFDIDKIIFLISIALFVLMYISVLRYILSTGISLLNSDVSSEMILANQLNHEGALLISRNWFYSSELRVLNTELIYRIGLAIFPNNWHWARLLSVALFLLILAGCVIWLMCAIGQKNYSFWAAIAVIAPFGRWYGWNVIFNSYYVPHIVISIISLALLCEINTNNNTAHKLRRNIYILLLFLLAFMSGLGGVRQLMICYVPLLGVGVILLIMKEKHPLHASFPIKSTFWISLLACIACGVGYLVNLFYLPKYYSFYSFADTTWKQFELDNYLSCISVFISLFGWQEDVPIFSLSGIINVASLLFVGVIIYSTVYLICKTKSLNKNEIIAILFFCTAFLLDLLIYGGTEQYNGSYWTTILPFAFVPLFIMLPKIAPPPLKKSVLLAGYSFLLFLSSYLTMESPYIDSPLIGQVPNSISIQNVSNWLSETDYTQGIASFWNSNIITELSDGNIEMWTIMGGNDESLTPRPWLQSVEHETLPVGDVFLLLTLRELSDMDLPGALEEYIVYVDDDYIVYGFDDISQYFDCFQ